MIIGTFGIPAGAPTNARLREVLSRAGRVVIVEGPAHRVDDLGLARVTVTGRQIADLGRLLAVVDGGTGDHCLCDGRPTLMVHGADNELIACWTLHHQSALRGLGNADADLRDGPALSEWLAQHGLTQSREAELRQAAQDAKAEQRRQRWMRAAPAGLEEAAAEVARESGDDLEAWSLHQSEARARLATRVHAHYPDVEERIRVLLDWFGVSAREQTGGMKWYDHALEKLLLRESPADVLSALTTTPPTPLQLDGASSLFCSLDWTGAQGRHLPDALRTALAAHIEATGTDTMRSRLQSGSYGATDAL